MNPLNRRKSYPVGPLLNAHKKSKCVSCSLAGGCGVNPLGAKGARIRKGKTISHATTEQQRERLTKW